MTTALTIVGSPIRSDLQLGELARALAKESPELIVYEWQPIPGRVMGAAFDWVAVLGTTADLLAVAGALWAVYSKLIKGRKKADSEQPPGLLLQVKTEQHTFVQFTIVEGTTEEVFVEEFTRSVSALRADSNGVSQEVVIERYERSQSHRRVRASRDAYPSDAGLDAHL